MAAFGLQGRGNELNGAGEREKDERREQGPRRPPDFGLLGLGEGRVFMEEPEMTCEHFQKEGRAYIGVIGTRGLSKGSHPEQGTGGLKHKAMD